MTAIRTIVGVLCRTEDHKYVLEDDDGHAWLLDFEWLALRLVNEWLGDRISIEGIRLGRNIFAVSQMEDVEDSPSPCPQNPLSRWWRLHPHCRP